MNNIIYQDRKTGECMVEIRPELAEFVARMELKLQKNDHKTGWRDTPIEALYRLMMLEISEFDVAYEHFSVDEARKELVDVANFCLILWDRMKSMDQEAKVQK